jgi:tripartite-type tricarboxylate transporter receptor subunit TctC
MNELTTFCTAEVVVAGAIKRHRPLFDERQLHYFGGREGAPMKHPRRKFLKLGLAAAAATAASRFAIAQTYPTRPMTMIVPFPTGGPTDVVGRVVAERMRSSLGQSIIVENVGGADGSIGAGRAARARPDGYTIELGLMGTHVMNGAVYSLRYDVLNDFAPISPLARSSTRLSYGT